MTEPIPDGSERTIDGKSRVYFDGYWIKSYPMPSDTLQEKRRLIEVLARRLFNHVEHGLYIPGARLSEARRSFETENDPERRRVKGGMLAASLFNRATDILTKLVELQALGVDIAASGPLMRTCGEHLKEALELGRLVLHRSGDEGIDELWGEPFKVFAFPVQEFYRSRYLKVAMAMRCIDELASELRRVLALRPAFAGIDTLIGELALAAKHYSETLRSAPDVFDVCASFAVARERLLAFEATIERPTSGHRNREVERGVELVQNGIELMASIARARVPMPKSTETFIRACQRYHSHFSREHEASGRPAVGRARAKSGSGKEARP